MKILLLPSWYPNIKHPGVGCFFREQASFLSRNGYDVKVLLGRNNEEKSSGGLPRLFRKPEATKDHLTVDFLLQEPDARSFGYITQSVWSEEKKHEALCVGYEKALKELQEEGWIPDLIHAQATVDGGIAASHLSRVSGIPYVIIEHQVFLMNLYSEFKQKLIKDALFGAKKVAAVSEYQRRNILINNINCYPEVIWNFVDEQSFTYAPGVKSDRFRILTITYPAFVKDPETFFRGMGILCERHPEEVEIVVVGSGSFDDLEKADTVLFEKLAHKHKVRQYCTFVPFMTRNRIAEAYHSADVFVSTSIAETFGISVREAMLSGTPVVCTASGGVDDTVNSLTGMKVGLRDAVSIADSVAKIMAGESGIDLQFARDTVVFQSGRDAFLKSMSQFYKSAI